MANFTIIINSDRHAVAAESSTGECIKSESVEESTYVDAGYDDDEKVYANDCIVPTSQVVLGSI